MSSEPVSADSRGELICAGRASGVTTPQPSSVCGRLLTAKFFMAP
jgi:hypothetical protein